ncbi:MAG: Nudix family hydrolase [Nevskiales bacterium]|nr:Nudix family hydrolase [Nevskiales bacterium]
MIHVAAGCLVNRSGEVLICQRPPGKIAAGKWEFPGGKIESGETVEQALHRELREELGISVRALRPLIRVRHAYRDRTVVLNAWRIDAFDGVPVAHEGQALAWVAPGELGGWDLLAADVPIVRALNLPVHYVFTPPDIPEAVLREGLSKLPSGALLRLRLPGLSLADYARLALDLLPICKERALQLILDRDPEMVLQIGAAGWHASSAVLARLRDRPVPAQVWMGGSCHTHAEFKCSRELGCDFAVLGPVCATDSHPDQAPLGWEGFSGLVLEQNLPVYAIGGLGPDGLGEAWIRGAQGVAGIAAYWS